MAQRMAPDVPHDPPAGRLDGAFWLVVVLAGACLALVVAAALRGGFASSSTGGGAGAPSQPALAGSAPGPSGVDSAAFLYPAVRQAPAISLIDPNGQTQTLASMRGGMVLVFFGYTHCPDVCPATIGTVEQVMAAHGPGIRTLFVTVDPERDTTTWLKDFDSYRSAQFTGLTGTDAQIRATADAWSVKYARVDTGAADAYAMSHTADVFVVDGQGLLRAHFPFGTTVAAMLATLRAMDSAAATTTPTQAPATTTTTPAGGGLQVEVDSSSIWAGGPDPLILTLSGPAGRLNDTTLRPVVQVVGADGSPAGGPVPAVAVRPPGVDDVSYVATVTFPTPGWWYLVVSATPGMLALSGTADIAVLDPGTTAQLGSAAPTIHSPTLADVSGDVKQLSTDSIPDLRLYGQSTSDVLAAHRAFVLVFDSAKFRVTSACGKALIMARYLEDRWPAIPFIHVEPFRYDVVTDTPVLEGSLADPTLTNVASAWGIGGTPWGPTSMPWVFVVDGQGVVRAKYQGVMGSADIDVLVALIAQGG
jgi:protein SCO1/2